MKTKSLKTRIGWFLAGILFLAMLLVSLVWGMFLKKDMVENETARLEGVLDTVQEWLMAGTGRGFEDRFSVLEVILHRNEIQCFFLHTEDGQSIRRGNEACFPDETLAEVKRQTKTNQGKVVAYHGTVWAVFTFSNEQVIVGKPLRNSTGEIFGTVIVGSSLEPLYSRIRQESGVVFFYILINTIIFAGIGLLRMMQVVVKPLERFVSLAQQYTPTANLNFFPVADNNEFANLSYSLNNLFSRIREDNKKLRETVSMLESANLELEHNKKEMVRAEKLAAIGRLSAGLAHEIGNPLGIIQGYVDLLARNDLSGEERIQFTQNSQLELDRIKTLIHRLLDFARPAKFPEQPVSVHDLIREVTGFVGIEKSFAHCPIIQQLDAARDVVTADADSLRQVLLNCLLNAVDAMASIDESKEILISTCNPESEVPNGFLSIVIQDKGEGFAEEDLPYVFDPFFTTKETGKGTGLGLYVCHTIVERLGGSIIVRSNPSGGAEVVITLPTTDSKDL